MGDKTLTVSEREIVKTLFAAGRTYHAIAKELGRSPHTVKKAIADPETAKQVEAIKTDLASMFEDIIRRNLESISEEDIKKSTMLQRMTTIGIGVDKMRLMRGQSTSNNVNLNVELSDTRYQEFLKLYSNKVTGNE